MTSVTLPVVFKGQAPQIRSVYKTWFWTQQLCHGM